MRKSRNGILAELLLGRANLAEIILLAIFLGLGVNLLSDGILGYLSDVSRESYPASGLVGGLVTCILCVLYFVVRIFGNRTRFNGYAGFFVVHKRKNEFIRVERYDFSEELFKYFDAAFFENAALKSIWDREPIGELPVTTPEKLRTRQLICEATEYYVLHKFSLHLGGHFANDKVRMEELRGFERNDVPDILLRNRFLELFSRPMEQRPHFVAYTFGEGSDEQVSGMYPAPHEEIRAMFERFGLVLPKKSTIKRAGANALEIETSRFRMNVSVRFDGYNTVLPYLFEKLYLFVDFFDCQQFQINIDIKVSFRFTALLSRAGWEYYQWVDSFLEELEQDFSADAFFESIGWNSAVTVIRYLRSPMNDESTE